MSFHKKNYVHLLPGFGNNCSEKFWENAKKYLFRSEHSWIVQFFFFFGAFSDLKFKLEIQT